MGRRLTLRHSTSPSSPTTSRATTASRPNTSRRCAGLRRASGGSAKSAIEAPASLIFKDLLCDELTVNGHADLLAYRLQRRSASPTDLAACEPFALLLTPSDVDRMGRIVHGGALLQRGVVGHGASRSDEPAADNESPSWLDSLSAALPPGAR